MGRLFAGTPFDRPPRCDRCGELEADCRCPPPPPPEPKRIDPSRQTARIRVEKRKKGKRVTVVRGLDPDGNDLTGLAAQLKAKIGSGGTVQEDGSLEIQGEHVERVARFLGDLGYKTKAE